ncbi:MAG: AEC family transporter [Fusobacteria bacterium]|nr:AEC family transporter [Fusobacteriota bacterium]
MFLSLHHIIYSLIPIILVVAFGWVAGSKKIIDNKHSGTLSTYVLYFSFPCALFIQTATTKPSQLFNVKFVIAFWIGLMLMYFIGYLVQRKVLKRDVRESAQGAFVTSFPNMAFMGIPIFTALFGLNSLISIVVGNICSSLLMIPIVTILLSGSSEKQSVFKIVKNVIKKPLIFAPILGVIYSFCGFHLPDVASHSLNLIGETTSGVSLFTMGLIMSSFVIKFNRYVVLSIILKNVIHPLLMMAIILIFGIKGILAKEAILLCAMPTATITTMFSLKYEVLAEETTSVTILGTIISLVTLTLFMLIVGIN